MRTGHLFAGAGGGLYADVILGHTPVFAVEWDDYAAAVLRERANEGWFPGLHLYHGDVRMFDTSPWKGRVDSIHAGFPCQDISVAGNGVGIDGERSGLWGEVKRIAGELRPQELFLENSPAITSRGLDRVLGDLAELGYDAQWCVLPASAVGAAHIRARWWCLAKRTDTLRMGRDEEREQGRNESIPNLNRQHKTQERNSQKLELRDYRYGADVADTMCPGREELNAAPFSDGPRFDTGKTSSQWREAWWSTEPALGRVADGVANRVNRIKALGNGQVPLQAAAAYVLLSGRLNNQINRSFL